MGRHDKDDRENEEAANKVNTKTGQAVALAETIRGQVSQLQKLLSELNEETSDG